MTDEKVQYIKIEPEYREEFMKGVAAFMRGELKLIKDVDLKVSQLMGEDSSHEEIQKREKSILTAPCYARFLMGELNMAGFLVEAMATIMQDTSLEGMRRAKAMLLASKDAVRGLILSPQTIELEVKFLKAAMRIAKREKMLLEQVFGSERFRPEIIIAAFPSIHLKREELHSVMEEELGFSMDEFVIGKWTFEELVDPDEIERVKKAIINDPDSAWNKAYKVALIIANEENMVNIYGDSQKQKLKREKLYEVLEFLKSKIIAA